ncbi:MAG: sulfotransferase [Gammaproteobacteria bacterium]
MDESALLQQARQATGLSDFGGEEFRPGLRVLLAALSESEHPPPVREALLGQCLQLLRTRLHLAAARVADPGIAAERIDAPIFVIGLPRTGTTALVDLMAQDPAARALMQWEVAAGIHPPPRRDAWASDPRIAEVDRMLAAHPGMSAIAALGQHTPGAMLPDECNNLLTLEFWTPNFSAATPLPRYTHWYRAAPPWNPFRFHRCVLQHLQHHGPVGRWTLKSPPHIFALSLLDQVYPDAMIVQTHRDPRQVMPSLCGLHATLRGYARGDRRYLHTGPELLDLWSEGMRRCIAARQDPALDARVLDIRHRDLAADPFAALERIYAQFGLDFSPAAQARFRAWIAQPVQQHSSVKFTLEEFGLDAASVDAAFAGYRERYGEYF